MATTNDANVDIYVNDYKLENREVKNVTLVSDNNKVRITFQLEGEDFPSYDQKTGERIRTNTFSLDIANVGLQCIPLNKWFERADNFLMGSNLPPALIKIVFRRAIINVDRLFRKKNTKRDSGEGIYSNDLFKSVITNIVPHLDDEDVEDIRDIIKGIKEVASKPVEVTTSKTTAKFGLSGIMW